MAWEVFNRKVILTGEPAVTLGKMGRIAINKFASTVLENNGVRHVQLLFDHELHKCAIKTSSSKAEGAYKLTVGYNGNGFGFSAVTFLNHIKYDWTETRSFPAEWNADKTMLIFSIPEEHFGATGDRRQPVGKISRTLQAKKFKRQDETTEGEQQEEQSELSLE
jgi:hypothetical protein